MAAGIESFAHRRGAGDTAVLMWDWDNRDGRDGERIEMGSAHSHTWFVPGAGGVLGSIIGVILAKRRAGAILATIGMVVPARTKIFCTGVISIGIVGVVMQIIDAERSASLVMLIGQAWLFAIFGIQAMLIAGTRWVLAERGIIGAKLFVPWQQVLACDWQDSNTLGIATKPGFRGPRRFTVSVAPEARERASAILASKITAN